MSYPQIQKEKGGQVCMRVVGTPASDVVQFVELGWV